MTPNKKKRQMKIFCINLRERTDRKTHMEAETARIGLRDVDYFTADRHPTSSAFGCYDSHYKCWQKLVASNDEYAMVLEDDVVFQEGFEAQLTNAQAFADTTQEEWDTIHLCFFPIVYVRAVSHGMWEASTTSCACYLVSRRFAVNALPPDPARPSHVDLYLAGAAKQYVPPRLDVVQMEFGSNNVWGTPFQKQCQELLDNPATVRLAIAQTQLSKLLPQAVRTFIADNVLRPALCGVAKPVPVASRGRSGAASLRPARTTRTMASQWR